MLRWKLSWSLQPDICKATVRAFHWKSSAKLMTSITINYYIPPSQPKYPLSFLERCFTSRDSNCVASDTVAAALHCVFLVKTHSLTIVFAFLASTADFMGLLFSVLVYFWYFLDIFQHFANYFSNKKTHFYRSISTNFHIFDVFTHFQDEIKFLIFFRFFTHFCDFWGPTWNLLSIFEARPQLAKVNFFWRKRVFTA